jgi:hypothetical protein
VGLAWEANPSLSNDIKWPPALKMRSGESCRAAYPGSDPAIREDGSILPYGGHVVWAGVAPGHRAFVAALGNNTVEVLDVAGRKRITSLRNIRKPTGIAFLPASNQVGVAAGEDGVFNIFRGDDYKSAGAILSLDDADNVRFDWKGRRIYVGYIDVISAAQGEPLRLIQKLPTREGARTSWFSSDLDELYLAVPNRIGKSAELRSLQAITAMNFEQYCS